MTTNDAPLIAPDETIDVDSLLEQAWQSRLAAPDRAAQIVAIVEERLDGTPDAERWRGCIDVLRSVELETQSRLDEALAHAVRAELALEGDDLWRARAITCVGVCHFDRGDAVAALEQFEHALEIRRSIGDRNGIGISLTNIGNVQSNLGRFDRALELYRESLAISLELDDRQRVATTYVNLGVLEEHLGNHREALSWFERSLELFGAGGSPGAIATVLLNIGSAHISLGELDEAFEALERSRALAAAHGLRLPMSAVLTGIAQIHLMRGAYERAIDVFEESLSIAQRIGDGEGKIRALDNISVCRRELGDLDEAERLGRAALSMAEELNQRRTAAQIHANLAETYRAKEEYRLALEHIELELEIERELGSAEAQRQLHAIEAARELELSRKEAEIERLRNVELAEAMRRLEESHAELKQAQTQLVQAEKMASLGQLTAGIAHEINNPVNFIRTGIGPLRRDIAAIIDGSLEESERRDVVEEIESLLRGIEEGAMRTAEIVRGLRTFSRLDEGDRKPVDLHEGLESTLALLRPRLGSITIERCFGALPPVECHPGPMNQVFLNLLMNAIDACEGTGTITIETVSGDRDVSIAITDTGIGITAENLPRIFDPFFTTKPVGSGQGLGLAIAYSIVEQHDGSIDVASAPGKGSRFTVTLPVH